MGNGWHDFTTLPPVDLSKLRAAEAAVDRLDAEINKTADDQAAKIERIKRWLLTQDDKGKLK